LESPLILACVDSSVSIYREVQSYSALHREHISGNVDYLELEELRKKALPILQSEHKHRREQFAHAIREHLDTSVASEKVSSIIQASYQGRIRVLFFDESETIEGRFDPDLQLPVVHAVGAIAEFNPYNTDLVESTVEQTIRHRGEVYCVPKSEMPGNGPLAALFRY
jgi:ParB-like chromosome segregation protein Spo0J